MVLSLTELPNGSSMLTPNDGTVRGYRSCRNEPHICQLAKHFDGQ
jgi:hypothetical protein